MIFKVGDVVRLKSGSTRMTVAAADDFHATCKWHENKEERQAQYQHEMLERVPSLGDLGGMLA